MTGGTAVDYDIEMEFHGPRVEMAAKAIKGEIESDIDTFFENVDDYEFYFVEDNDTNDNSTPRS